MSQGNSIVITVESVSEHIQVDYSDGDIVFIDNLHDLSEHAVFNDTVRIDVIMILMCIKGKGQVRVKDKTYMIYENYTFCGAPNTIINDCMVSPDFEAKIMLISPHIIQSLIRTDKNVLNHYYNLMRNPVINVGENGIQLMEYYYKLLMHKMKMKDRPFSKETISALVSAALYDFLGELGSPADYVGRQHEHMAQGDVLFRRFIELLSSTSPVERSVAYYGRQLCVTPKYLSTTVKNVSGRTALKWIADYVMKDIRQQLLYTDLSVKEISATLGFPNLSFFGKYVKEHLGVSPTEFRRNGGRDVENGAQEQH